MTPMIADDDETALFGAAYSPRHIRFYLLHWPAIAGLGQYRASAAAFTQLAHEWTRLAAHPDFDCFCAQLNDGIPTREEYRGGGEVHGVPLGTDLRGDLTSAADALPITWRATRRVFELQERVTDWGAHLSAYRDLGMPRKQDRWIEPPFDPPHGPPPGERCDNPFRCGSGAVAVRLMALDRGWRPQSERAA